ncbi:MAG: SMC-Scp complex subunit ScpB [Patescibacteria group bacterium]
MNLKSVIESLLFVSDRPLSKKELAKITKKSLVEIEKAIEELILDYKKNERGISLLRKDDKVQMSTSPENSEFVKKFLDSEIKEEITPASLETLAIISYRGPITKEELDEIRGVNCAIILRHLMVKGLVEEIKKEGKTFYNLTFDFMRYLGIKDQRDLPSYEKFHNLEIKIHPLINDSGNQNNSFSHDTNQ